MRYGSKNLLDKRIKFLINECSGMYFALDLEGATPRSLLHITLLFELMLLDFKLNHLRNACDPIEERLHKIEAAIMADSYERSYADNWMRENAERIRNLDTITKM